MKLKKILPGTLLIALFHLASMAQGQQQGQFGIHFRHVVSPENNLGHNSYLNHPEINNNPDAIIIASPAYGPNQIPAENNFRVFFNSQTGRWAIRNVNSPSSLPMGCAFNILIPDASQDAFRVFAPGGSLSFMFNHPATDGNPDKLVFITPVYVGAPSVGLGNRQFVAMYAPGVVDFWGLGSSHNTEIQQGDAFNILVLSESDYSFVHRVTDSNSSLTEIDNPLFNARPEADFIFQRQFIYGSGDGSTTFNTNKKSTAYIDGKWHIQIDNGNTFHLNEDYNIALLNFSQGISCADPIPLGCDATTPVNVLSGENDNELAAPQDCADVDEPVGSGGQRWFKYTAANDDLVTVASCDSSGFLPVMHVYTGSCGDFTCVASSSNDCSDAAGTEVSFEVEEGVDYFVRVGGPAPTGEEFSLHVTCQSTVSARAHGDNETEIVLYPNPAGSHLNVRCKSSTGDRISHEILDLSGKTLSKGAHTGTDRFQLDLSALSTGSYFLKLTSANFVAVEKFVVSH